MRKVLQSTMRGGSLFWDFRTFNPPISKNNWANEYALLADNKEDTLLTHNTYLDVPVDWLGQQFIYEAEDLKELNEKAYTHEYLGVPVGTGGDVFPNVEDFDSNRLVPSGSGETELWKTFDNIYNGIDWGFANDPFRFVRCHFDAKHLNLYVFKEYSTLRTRNSEVFDILYNELKLVSKEEMVVCDSAEEKSIADFKAYGAFVRPAIKGADSVRYGIKWLQGLNKIYIDKRVCPLTYAEFMNYEYEQDRNGAFISQYPDKDNHSIDACVLGDTLVHTTNGLTRIDNLVDSESTLYAYDTTCNKVVEANYIHCRQTKMVDNLIQVRLNNGEIIKCTNDHRLLTSLGYKRADELTITDKLVVYDSSRDEICHILVYSIKHIYLDELVPVYDLEVPKYHNFIINKGTVVHNCRYALNRYWARKGN